MTSAGYSGTPLPKKLGIKPGHRLLLEHAPEGFLPDRPEDVQAVASGPADVTEDAVREIALRHRLVDNEVCAIDEFWSGLRLVIRLTDR